MKRTYLTTQQPKNQTTLLAKEPEKRAASHKSDTLSELQYHIGENNSRPCLSLPKRPNMEVRLFALFAD